MFVNNVALLKVGLRMVSNCFKNLKTHNLKTIFLRVLSQVKQTITSIKLLIGIGKQGRRTDNNQCRSV